MVRLRAAFTTIPIARARSTTAASDAPLVGRWNGSSRMPTLTINGQSHNVDADPDMPLLWALRENVGLTGTKYGCGIAQCGACTIHIDGVAVRSCLTPV